jgi:glycosyltransferase involved in cell wall biosynthesis
LFTWSGLEDSVSRGPGTSAQATVSVVIPARNEAANIGWVLRRLPDCVDEVVLVDGRSTDGTIDVARAIRPDIVVVSDEGRGKGAALRTGFAAASGDWVVMIDADGSMDPYEIEPLVAGLAAGHDVARGSRFVRGGGTADMTWIRRIGNMALLATANVLFRASNTDLCYGYAAFRRQAVQPLELDADGFEIEAQFFLRARRCGLRICEIASFEAPRRSGVSNLHAARDGWRVLTTILRERFAAPRAVGQALLDGAAVAVAAPLQAGFLTTFVAPADGVATELAAIVSPADLTAAPPELEL